MNFWQKAQRFPPVLCRLLARRPKGRPYTVDEICAKSGLNPWEVESISRLTSWNTVCLEKMQAFLNGCSIDLESRNSLKRVYEYMRVKGHRCPQFKYLRISPELKTIYAPLLKIFLHHLICQPPTHKNPPAPPGNNPTITGSVASLK